MMHRKENKEDEEELVFVGAGQQVLETNFWKIETHICYSSRKKQWSEQVMWRPAGMHHEPDGHREF